MTPRTASGQMRFRVAFYRRAEFPDGAGNTETDFEKAPRFTRWARITPLKGGEEVTAARLQGTQPAIIRVRSDSQTRTIGPQWRAVDIRRDTAYAVKTISNVDEKDVMLDILCESGLTA